MRGILVRIGLDRSYGGWNAPVDHATGRFCYVPIPESKDEFRPGLRRSYAETRSPVHRFLDAHNVRDGRDAFPLDDLADGPMHLDPDFEHLTYGDDGSARGSAIRTLGDGDFLVFYAGLKAVHPPRRPLVYAIVGFMLIREVILARDVSPERRHENAHTRKAKISDADIVVRGHRAGSGLCERCVAIGEYRSRAYRVRQDVLDAWGGLSVRDGYLQRSGVPPQFVDPGRFMAWWTALGIPLLHRNF
jgi:hypothetical protein